jgi:hypothetical protein
MPVSLHVAVDTLCSVSLFYYAVAGRIPFSYCF